MVEKVTNMDSAKHSDFFMTMSLNDGVQLVITSQESKIPYKTFENFLIKEGSECVGIYFFIPNE